ncbi:lysozyme [Novosphingobium sp. KN65.2]|uniref:lysozyme n=1 Tax=Novosphingobium sp. KN65.2 TaxID=1478134 RepID=UPI0005DB73BC|nr:lysozyme [Novosphingobium sp. KN65.2]CDO37284.1 Lysozyme [Novosphingobium sp. KN65.2]
MNRKPIFDAVRQLLGRGFRPSDVALLDAAIDSANHVGPAAAGFTLGEAGRSLIRKWEGCARRRPDGRFEAYPDPGSATGEPWTIGWGSTGSDIRKGLVWTQEQCDARFDRDIVRFVEEVHAALGDAATTQGQFDALVSFHYNTGAIRKATLTRLHREKRFAEAALEFAKWIYNDGKPLPGLKKRRAEEAALYRG